MDLKLTVTFMSDTMALLTIFARLYGEEYELQVGADEKIAGLKTKVLKATGVRNDFQLWYEGKELVRQEDCCFVQDCVVEVRWKEFLEFNTHSVVGRKTQVAEGSHLFYSEKMDALLVTGTRGELNAYEPLPPFRELYSLWIGSGLVEGMAATETMLYVCCGDEGVRKFSIEGKRQAPKPCGSLWLNTAARDIAVGYGRAVVAGDPRLVLLDASNPALCVVGSFSVTGERVALSAEITAVLQPDSQILLYNTELAPLATLQFSAASGIFLSGSILFVTRDHRIERCDITDPEDPRILFDISISGTTDMCSDSNRCAFLRKNTAILLIEDKPAI